MRTVSKNEIDVLALNIIGALSWVWKT
jgi:hypothetical protein